MSTVALLLLTWTGVAQVLNPPGSFTFGQQQPGFGNPGFYQQQQQQPGIGQQQPGFGQQQPGFGQRQPGFGNPGFLQQPLGQFQSGSQTFQCDNSNLFCARRTHYCNFESCKYECNEVGSCAMARFVSSPGTRELEVLCKKPNACKGAQILSSAPITKVQCDDFACVQTKMACSSTMGELCEFKCQGDGCTPQIMSNMQQPGGMGGFMTMPQIPVAPLGLKMLANEVFCTGMIKECRVSASSEFSFMHGKFTCQNTGGLCLLECADTPGEVSCRGSKYLCKTNAAFCLCHDQRHNNMPGSFVPVMPQPRGGMFTDCPKITMPTLAPTKAPKPVAKSTKKVAKKVTKKTTNAAAKTTVAKTTPP